MKIAFISNIYNPHVGPICEAFSNTKDIDFKFIACDEPSNVGGSAMAVSEVNNGLRLPLFVIQAWKSGADRQSAIDFLKCCTVIILGSGDITLLPNDISTKIFFIYSERPLKQRTFITARALKLYFRYRNFDSSGAICLCASAYAKKDYMFAHLFGDRFLKWGYFPEGNQKRNLDEKIIGQNGNLKILWSGRMLHWKKPLDVIPPLLELKKMNIPFSATFIGEGEEKAELEKRVEKNGLANLVSFFGFAPYQTNLKLMAESDVYFFTSGRQEGWGACLNEAMSSKMVIIANEAAGSTSFLLKDSVNGYVYRNRHELLEKTKKLADFESNQRIAVEARKTIRTEWNAEIAVNRLMQTIQYIQINNTLPKNSLFIAGPCELQR